MYIYTYNVYTKQLTICNKYIMFLMLVLSPAIQTIIKVFYVTLNTDMPLLDWSSMLKAVFSHKTTLFKAESTANN